LAAPGGLSLAVGYGIFIHRSGPPPSSTQRRTSKTSGKICNRKAITFLARPAHPAELKVNTPVVAYANFSHLIECPFSDYDEVISNLLMTKVKKNTPILNQLRKYRKARGLKQRQAARIIGLADASSLSRWEHGTSLPSVMNMFRLAALYRTLVDALYIDAMRTIREDVRRREIDVLAPKDHAW
jgi:DNA-binding XRE family transcriptional regulator